MAVLLIKKSKFKQGLPAGFGWNQASQQITVDQSYNLVTDDKEFAGQARAFEVNNVDEIEAIKNQIFSKPLISVAKCSKQYKEYRSGRDSEGNREVEYHTMIDEFVVVLNTSHPEVQRVLNETFEKAKQLMQENAKFVVVFDLDDSTKTWYGQVAHANSDGKTAQSVGASFYIVHNASPEANCAKAFFGCEQPVQIAMWCVCFPCCLLTGVPYHVCRKCIQNIKDEKIPARFHTQEYNNVCPPGANLLSLFQTPQQVVMTVTTQYPGQQYPPQQYAPPPYGQPPAQPGYTQPPMAMQPQYPQYPQQGYQQQAPYPQPTPYNVQNPGQQPQYPATQH
jgi:hypothetical protein